MTKLKLIFQVFFALFKILSRLEYWPYIHKYIKLKKIKKKGVGVNNYISWELSNFFFFLHVCTRGRRGFKLVTFALLKHSQRKS
jgi:hypothetical protein